MLAEERFAAILQLLQEKKTVTVNELTKTLHISESTIRRDLVSLHKMKKLRKVHGGATLLQKEYAPIENDVTQRSQEHIEEKRRLAQYAATLIEPHDFIYLDAGSTILHMAEFIEEKDAVYVTNSLYLSERLAIKGMKVFILAGEIKAKTMAVVGLGAVSALQKYNFTKAFLGTNGIIIENGFTTPDMEESYVKCEAMKHAQKCYVLADASKFNLCTAMSTADISDAIIITSKGIPDEYKEETEVIEVAI